MRYISGIVPRIRTSIAYSRLAYSYEDRLSLALVGLARYRDFSASDLLSRAMRKIVSHIEVRPRRLGGMRAVINLLDASEIDIFEEIVVNNAYDMSLVPFEPDYIIDCGGHIGLFTARAAATFTGAKMIVFEPSPHNASVIRDLVRRNRINATINEEAVSDRNCMTTFYERNSCGGSIHTNGWEFKGTYPVHVVDLVSQLRVWSPSRLLLKMDIEGEEENLLPKLRSVLPKKCAIFFETHSGLRGWERVVNALNDDCFEIHLLSSRDPFRDGFAIREF